VSGLAVRQQPTRGGTVALIADPAAFAGDRPVALFLHGALRSSNVLLDWAPALADAADAVFVDLPGHGRSPGFAPATLERMTAEVAEAVAAALPGRRIVAVGESFGGLVALALAGLGSPIVEAVVAADPPLTTAKQWQLNATFERVLAQRPDDPVLASFAREMFGIAPGVQEERIYYPLFEGLAQPVHVVTGDLRLQPPRRLAGVGCLVDEVDAHVLKAFPNVRIHRFEGAGHLVLNDRRDACLPLIQDLLASGARGASA
jgi:pimeloyl-ACP methyl ester carboxylesterase